MMIVSPLYARGISKIFSTNPPTADRKALLQQKDAAMSPRGVNAGMTTGEVGPGYAQLYSQTGYRRKGCVTACGRRSSCVTVSGHLGMKFSGRTKASQALEAGSTPVIRSTRKRLISTDFSRFALLE